MCPALICRIREGHGGAWVPISGLGGICQGLTATRS